MKKSVAFLALVITVLRFWPHQKISEQVPVSTNVWSSDGELLRATLATDEQYRLWTPLPQIAPSVADAFLLKEDRWFYLHPGFNPASLARAAFATYGGGLKQGGSTITMQLARLLYRLNTRTAGGKLRQIAAAVWLEARYSKRELLEAYLNLAPFGGNVQGVGAASRILFGKPPNRITLAEALTLAVIPQSPAARTGGALRQENLLKARTRLAAAWVARHGSGESDRRQLSSPIGARAQFEMPRLAPHFVDSLLAARLDRAPRLDTTLDSRLQRLVERQVRNYVEEHGDRGIRNAAVLVLRAKDMSVKAWVGSADFGNEEIDGQVDGVQAKRSPGSALKPFVYALALDQGVLHPRTILRDAPAAFGEFTPENFDGQFLGPLPAQDALIRSRNVPAVWVSMQLRKPNFYEFLQSAGVTGMKSESFYGLALALGGVELSMVELTELYGMLANQGVLRPIRTVVRKRGGSDEGVRMLSPEAAFITGEMLRRNPRPDEDGSLPVRTRWSVAWKTGTSWGFRDAWSAGIVGPYIVAVWIGDFSGKGNPSFVGVDAAAPLFFRIADALNMARADEPAADPVQPPGVARVSVCAASGDLPNRWCPTTVTTWYIPGKSPIRVSQLHRAIAIDTATGRPSCPPYSPASTRYEVFEFWPSDMLRLFRKAGMPRRTPPRVPDCAAGTDSEGPRIASPLRGSVYNLPPSGDGSSIPLEASASGDVQQMFWFDGSALIGRVSPGSGAVAWRPATDGAHLVRVIDDHGRSSEREVQVAFRP